MRIKAIKWKQGELQAAKHQASLYNRRIRYAEQRNPATAAAQVQRIDVRNLGKNIRTRSDLAKLTRRIEKTGFKELTDVVRLESGRPIVRAEKQRLEREIRQVNQKRAAQAAERGIAFKPGEMGKHSELKPITIKLENIRGNEAWRQFVQSVEKQAMSSYDLKRLEQYKANYLKSARKNFGKAGKSLYDFVSKMPAADVYQAFVNNPDLSIATVYESDLYDDLSAFADALLDAWMDAVE